MSDQKLEVNLETHDTHFLVSPCSDSPIPSPRRVLNNIDLLAVNDCITSLTAHSSANSTRSSSLSSLNSINDDDLDDDEFNTTAQGQKKRHKVHKKENAPQENTDETINKECAITQVEEPEENF